MDHELILYYSEHAKEVSAKYEAADMSRLHDWLLEVFPAGCSVLELGCGWRSDYNDMV